MTIKKGLIGEEDIKWYDGANSTFSRVSPSGGIQTLAPLGVTGGYLTTLIASNIDLPWYFSSDYADVGAAVTAIGATEAVLVIDEAETLTANLTVPSTTHLVILKGGSLVKASTYTVTINGPFEAGPFQVFSGFATGNVIFGAGMVEKVFPEWWYTGSGSYHTAAQCAVDSLNSLPGVIKFGSKTYSFTSGFTMTNHRQHLIGDGPQTTWIDFNPTVAAVWVTIGQDDGDPQQVGCTMGGFGFKSSDTTYKKTFLKTQNLNGFHLYDILSADGVWTGATSVGFQFCGADHYSVERIQISADLCIQISNNPNAAYPDLDHFTFRDIYLYATDSTNPVVKIDTGLLVQNMIWEGHNGFARGSHGIYWVDTTSSSPALNISIKNIRWEQSTGTGYFFYIEHNTGLYQLSLENCYMANASYVQNFMRLAKVYQVSVQSCTHFITTGSGGYWGYFSSSVQSVVLKNFMTLGTLSDNTTYGVHKVYDSYDYSPGISLLGTFVVYAHYAIGPKITYPLQAELGIYDNNLRIYSNGKGIVLTTVDGTLTKLVRLNGVGDGIEIADPSDDTPPGTDPVPDTTNMLTGWTNISYDTGKFTATGPDIDSAEWTSGTELAQTLPFTVTGANGYTITATLTLTSGQAPIMSWIDSGYGSGTSLGSLSNGANVFAITTSASAYWLRLSIYNTAASTWSCTFTVVETP